MKMEFTPEQQAHIDALITTAKTEWETSVLSPIVTERDELLQYKPVQKSDAEIALDTKQAELFQKEIQLELKAKGYEDFADFLNVEKIDDLQGKMDKLSSILDARKLTNAFEPDDKRQTSSYDQAAGKKDAVGMIGAKFAKLFQ